MTEAAMPMRRSARASAFFVLEYTQAHYIDVEPFTRTVALCTRTLAQAESHAAESK